MPTYTYSCDVHGEFEFQHSINDKLEECPHCKEENLATQKVKRLISNGGGFILSGGGWAKDLYSK